MEQVSEMHSERTVKISESRPYILQQRKINLGVRRKITMSGQTVIILHFNVTEAINFALFTFAQVLVIKSYLGKNKQKILQKCSFLMLLGDDTYF